MCRPHSTNAAWQSVTANTRVTHLQQSLWCKKLYVYYKGNTNYKTVKLCVKYVTLTVSLAPGWDGSCRRRQCHWRQQAWKENEASDFEVSKHTHTQIHMSYIYWLAKGLNASSSSRVNQEKMKHQRETILPPSPSKGSAPAPKGRVAATNTQGGYTHSKD